MFSPSIIVLSMLEINSMQIGNLQHSTTVITVPFKFLLLEGNGFAFFIKCLFNELQDLENTHTVVSTKCMLIRNALLKVC